MAQNTGIEWTDATWSPVHGCTRVSPGCENCYAERMAARFPENFGLCAEMTAVGPRWAGLVALRPEALDQPLRWRKPKRIFVCSMSDLFHEQVPDEFIAAVFGVMSLAGQHTFQVLTKRPERMVRWFASHDLARCQAEACSQDLEFSTLHARLCRIRNTSAINSWPLPNVWIGVSAENQHYADERIPLLLQVPAAVRFVSYEPALGPLDASRYLRQPWLCEFCYRTHYGDRLPGDWDLVWQSAVCPDCQKRVAADGGYGVVPAGKCASSPDPRPWRSPLHWLIAGGESGPGARAPDPEWFRDLRDQCASAGVPFFFKAWGEWAPVVDHLELRHVHKKMECFGPEDDQECVVRIGKRTAGALLDGREHKEFPA